jgi:hypothetical protein
VDRSSSKTTVLPISNEPLIQLEQYIIGWAGEWTVFKALSAFARSPSPEALALCLREICATGTLDAAKQLDVFPWLIESIIQCAADNEQLEASAVAAESGEFGNLEAWLAAEKRWTTEGITIGDFMEATPNRPFGHNIATRGAPLIGFTRPFGLAEAEVTASVEGTLSQLLEVRRQVVNQAVASHLARAAEFVIRLVNIRYSYSFSFLRSMSDHRLTLSAGDSVELLSIVDGTDLFNFSILNLLDNTAWEDETILSLLSQRISKGGFLWGRTALPVNNLINAFTFHPDFRPFLYAVAFGIVKSDVRDAEPFIAQLPPNGFLWSLDDPPCTSAGIAVLRILKSRCPIRP